MTPPRSPARQAIDQVLADGNWHTRDELLEAAAAKVPPGQAWRTGETDRRRTNPGQRTRGDDHTAIVSGARMAADDVLRGMARIGTIERGPDGLYRAAR
jgi:diadenosine tetraphosphatase ApaH/serine/threonine PP2A family protein phosphatase